MSDKKLKIVALPITNGKLESNCLFKSLRMFYGLWNNFDYIQENTYENECEPYHVYIYEDDKYGYNEGDLVYTTNCPVEHVKAIDRDYGTQKWYEWLITVENNKNQYKPCEMYGKIVATSDSELAKKHGIDFLDINFLTEFISHQGNVDVNNFLIGKETYLNRNMGYSLIPNDYQNTNKSILTVDVSERYEVSREEYEKLKRSHITLGWNDESKGYDIVLKNRYGHSGRIYSESEIEQIRETAFLEGKSSVEFE